MCGRMRLEVFLLYPSSRCIYRDLHCHVALFIKSILLLQMLTQIPILLGEINIK